MIYPQAAYAPADAATYDGDVVVVTGATSETGRILAAEAARHDARVVMTAPAGDELDAAVETLERQGGRVVGLPADAPTAAATAALARRIVQRWGRIDAWVASVVVELDDAGGTAAHELERDLLGPLRQAAGALPYLEVSGGTLIGIGTIVASRELRVGPQYRSAERAVNDWRDDMRRELRERGASARVDVMLRWQQARRAAAAPRSRPTRLRRAPVARQRSVSRIAGA